MQKSPRAPHTLVELLRERAANQPDKVAYTFLTDGETQEVCLTYRVLDQRAQEIAAQLQTLTRPGDRVLLLYPPGLGFVEAFFGCLYAGVVAVPTYPPRRNRENSRLQLLARDAQPQVILAHANFRAMQANVSTAPLTTATWLFTGENMAEQMAAISTPWRAPTITADTLAFLQYTSGSTGNPKGVMISHGNLLYNEAMMQHAFEQNAESVVVSWLPLYHDMGLIGALLQPLYVGGACVLLAPETFIQNPVRWLQAITRYRATTSGGPNFAYDLCAQLIADEQGQGLDLSTWDVAFCGAEPVRAATIERFVNKFAPYGFRRAAFYPCYGMAETTLFISGGLKTAPPVYQTREPTTAMPPGSSPAALNLAKTVVSCGRAWLDEKLCVVDPTTQTLCPEGQIGEIWIAGPHVAQGYWNQPTETKATFQAYLAAPSTLLSAGPFLRTGDLGFLQAGELFVTGRSKDLIIIRGRNHYPQDLELTATQSHEALQINSSAAFSVDVDGEERLVIAQEIKRTARHGLDGEAISNTIRQAISAQHELETYAVLLLKPGSVPKTTSGKIQRQACRTQFLAGEFTAECLYQWTALLPRAVMEQGLEFEALTPPSRQQAQVAQWLRHKLAELLGVTSAAVDFQQPLHALGLGSFNAITLKGALEAEFNVTLPMELFFEERTVAQLLQQIVTGEAAQPSPAEASRSAPSSPPAFTEQTAAACFADFPEIRQIQQLVADLGEANPYFVAHEGVNTHTTQIQGQTYHNYASYNYLGLAGDPAVTAQAKAAIDQYGTSASASRLTAGEIPIQRELEMALAELVGAEDCLVFVGGFTTNATTIGHLFGPLDLILHDALIHNSALEGTKRSGATTRAFPHNDWQALDALLQTERAHYRRVLIVIEGAYSMDGDIPDLPRFIAVKQRHQALLMIDEAHSIGVLGQTGQGIGEHFGIDPATVDIWMGTLSKAFASCGGYIAGSKALITYLKYTAPGFVYSVGISPPNTAAALAAVRRLRAEPERVAQLHARAKLFLQLAQARGLDTGLSQGTPIIPVIVGDSHRCMQLAQRLFARGIYVLPIVFPAVPENAARLRFFLSCTHTEPQIRETVAAVAEALAPLVNTPFSPGDVAVKEIVHA